MPANFADAWLDRVRKNLTTADVAPWLDGIPELDVQVIEVGSGSASESNVIHIPTSSFNPDVLINNTTYPIALQAYTDSEVTVQLDKYQTKVTTLTDDQVIGASYNRIDSATKSHTVAITTSKYAKAIHAIAPSADATLTPVVVATGAAVGTRNALTYNDLVTLKGKFDTMECPAEGRRLVLSTDHYNDLLLDRANFANLLMNHAKGTLMPTIAGFEIFQYVSNPLFTSAGAKKAFGAVSAAGDRRASVAFFTGNIAKKTGLTKQYYADSKIDPENQTNRLAYRHYFIAVPAEAKYIGAIY